MSSLLNVNPGISPRFLSQNMEAKDPLKNIPSTAANAIKRSAKVADSLEVQAIAHLAFFLTQGKFSIALNRKSLKIQLFLLLLILFLVKKNFFFD
jgi:hypothetical protein